MNRLLVVLMGVACVGMGQAATIYVSPRGNDTWLGEANISEATGTNGPLLTLEGARNRVRQLREAGKIPSDELVTVLFAAGEYPISRPVLFEPQDSFVRYCASEDCQVTIFGGRRLPVFNQQHDGLWQMRIPKGKFFEQLYVNDTRVQRAKSPNEFYYYMQSPVKYGKDPVTGREETDFSRRAFIADLKDVAPLAGRPLSMLTNVVLRAFHSWEVSQARLQQVDGKTGLVVGTGVPRWKYFNWSPYLQRYQLENFREALDMPGEWFADSDTGLLSYLPRKNERISVTRAVAPVTDSFLKVQGDALAGQWVRNLTFEGLRFHYAGYWLPPEGQSDGQASINQPAAIEVNGAKKILFRNCEIAHTGAHGIWFKKGVRESSLIHCRIHDLGGGAVYIGDKEWSAKELPDALTAMNTVDNCILQDGGHVLPGSIGLWIGHAADNRITHNDISDFYYTGVSIGWSWGYHKTVSKRNLLSHNHIHHLGKGMLNDMGGVYTLGNSEGTVVSHNHIHDVWSYDYSGRGGWGLYTDEGSSGIVFEKNLVHHVKTGCIHQHYGKENIFRHNVLACSLYGQIQRSRIEDHTSIIVTNNVIYWDNDSAMVWRGGSSAGRIDEMVFDHNLYWNPKGLTNAVFHGRTWDQWRKEGQDFHSLCADPDFEDPAQGDFRVGMGSVLTRAGYFLLDPEDAGVYGDDDWRQLAVRSHKKVRFAPVPPLYKIARMNIDFETIPVRKTPPEWKIALENQGDAIEVSDRKAYRGKRALMFQDMDNLKRSWMPHAWFDTYMTNGVIAVRFAFQAEPKAAVSWEWRDLVNMGGTAEYLTGGSVSYANGAFFTSARDSKASDASVKYTKLADCPADKWAVVLIRCYLDGPKQGTWSAQVEVDGKVAGSKENLYPCSPKFRFFNWFGVIATGTAKARFWMDDFSFGEER